MIDWEDPATVERLEELASENPRLRALVDQAQAAHRDLRGWMLRKMAARGRQAVLDDLSMGRPWLREHVERVIG